MLPGIAGVFKHIEGKLRIFFNLKEPRNKVQQYSRGQFIALNKLQIT